MSDKERKREQSMRLFEALSDVSPELLARSEKKVQAQVIRLWGGRFGRYAAACLAILLVGGISLYTVKNLDGWKDAGETALPNNAAGGQAFLFRGDSAVEQIAEPIEAGVPMEAAENDDVQKEKPEQKNETGSGEESAKDPENSAAGSSGQQGNVSEDTAMQAVLSEPKNITDRLPQEDVERMGSLAAYAPVSLPEGYAVSDTRVSVDESGIGNYVIVMSSEEGKVLEYRVSCGQESGTKDNVIYLSELRDGAAEAELTEMKPEERKETAVVALYEDGVQVEVRGDYTLEILLEICPRE